MEGRERNGLGLEIRFFLPLVCLENQMMGPILLTWRYISGCSEIFNFVLFLWYIYFCVYQPTNAYEFFLVSPNERKYLITSDRKLCILV